MGYSCGTFREQPLLPPGPAREIFCPRFISVKMFLLSSRSQRALSLILLVKCPYSAYD